MKKLKKLEDSKKKEDQRKILKERITQVPQNLPKITCEN